MTKSKKLHKAFESFFVGPDGFFQLPGNVGGGRTVAAICNEIMVQPQPFLFELVQDWDEQGKLQTQDGHQVKLLQISLALRSLGQWEGAWSLAQLHYDQFLKKEAVINRRLGKGHPLCGLAILAREIGSPTLTRHYAMLSSAGDVYMEHQNPELRHGGYGPTMLEQFESRQLQWAWRDRIRTALSTTSTNRSRYVESFLASRWFSDNYAQHFLAFADVRKHGGKPFVDVLLDVVDKSPKGKSTTTGACLEAAAGLLFSSTPGFEVDSARKTSDEQVDLVVEHVPERWAQLGLDAGCGLIECKSSLGKVSAAELRDFGGKCLFHRVKFGVLIARAGITGGAVKPDALFKEPQNAELTRRRFQVDGLTLLVLDISQLRGKSRDLRGVLDELRADYRQLVFGPVA